MIAKNFERHGNCFWNDNDSDVILFDRIKKEEKIDYIFVVQIRAMLSDMHIFVLIIMEKQLIQSKKKIIHYYFLKLMPIQTDIKTWLLYNNFIVFLLINYWIM